MKSKKVPIAVFVSSTNTIGIILDEGQDNFGKWYRTDCDGVRDISELLFLYSKKDIRQCKKQLNAHIAPTTKKLLGL